MFRYLSAIIFTSILQLGAISDARSEEEKVAFSIATLNAEFLSFRKVHLKHRYDNNGEELRFPFYLKVTDGTAEEVLRSALTSADKYAGQFINRFNNIDGYREAVLRWADSDFRANKLLESSKEVAKVIKEVNADVIVLTEVGNKDDLSVLDKVLKTEGVTYPHIALCKCTDSKTGQYVAVLSKFKFREVLQKVPGKESYLQEDDDPESEKQTSLSKALRVLFEVEGQLFYLYGLHFRSERGYSEADGQRVAQASLVRRHYRQLLSSCVSESSRKLTVSEQLSDGSCRKKSKPIHVIVAGDLNDKRGQPTLKRVRGLDDIEPDLIQTGTPDYFENHLLNTRWTYEYKGDRNQIDHILLSESILQIHQQPDIRKPGTPSIVASTIDHNNHKATDHKALKVEVEFFK